MIENDSRDFNPKFIRLYKPSINSHKGQNGKLLVIGGSELFHSSIFWSADVASRIVDLVHLTSPANENNQIFRSRLKEKFWNGIVVDWKDVESYIEEDDCVLIGPGMTRNTNGYNGQNGYNGYSNSSHFSHSNHSLSQEGLGGKDDTEQIVNYLLSRYPAKRWVIDGGALQEVDLELITESCILTPHKKEFQRLTEEVNFSENSENSESRISSENQKVRHPENQTLRVSDIPTFRSSEYSECSELSKKLNSCIILLKGPTDIVCQGNKCIEIKGGNPGMTKGGTGDVLAGLAAALYTKNDSWTAATMASYINKKAGDSLYKRVGPYFNAEDLVREVPLTIYGIMKKNVST